MQSKATQQEQAREALWNRGLLSWKLWEQQQSIYATVRSLPITAQTVVLLCARQFGKSVLGVILAVEDCLQNPDAVVLIVGPTIKQTRAIVRPRMKLVTKDAPPGLIHPVKSEDCWYFSNGSELRLGGFDSNSSAQRGKTLHKIYLEETCDSDGDDYLDFLQSDLGPALTHSKHAQIIHLTTLPKVPDHPFVKETIPEAIASDAFFEFTIHDNKQLTPEKYAQCVKLCGGEHTIAFQREYLCKQVRDTSIILVPEFDEAKHVADIIIPEYGKYWLGGDIGGTRDKSVVYLCTYDFLRAKTLILDERVFEPDTSSSAQMAAIADMVGHRAATPATPEVSGLAIDVRWIDCPGQTRIDYARDYGFHTFIPPNQGDNLDTHVNQVRVAFTKGQVEISRKCKFLIQTLRSGTFNHNRTDLARTKTLGHMDGFMALSYAIRQPIKSNPYPAVWRDSPHAYYIPEESRKAVDQRNARAVTGQTIKSLFAVRK